mmetsp:Transcript_2480/g.5137  ORF Transcript_2480/g.5137 Transcript_2480/m.5137 type:complete len:203 (-) Transcript_2480:472-1080(-)
MDIVHLIKHDARQSGVQSHHSPYFQMHQLRQSVEFQKVGRVVEADQQPGSTFQIIFQAATRRQQRGQLIGMAVLNNGLQYGAFISHHGNTAALGFPKASVQHAFEHGRSGRQDKPAGGAFFAVAGHEQNVKQFLVLHRFPQGVQQVGFLGAPTPRVKVASAGRCGSHSPHASVVECQVGGCNHGAVLQKACRFGGVILIVGR